MAAIKSASSDSPAWASEGLHNASPRTTRAAVDTHASRRLSEACGIAATLLVVFGLLLLVASNPSTAPTVLTPTPTTVPAFANVALGASELTARCAAELVAATTLRDELSAVAHTKAALLAKINAVDVHRGFASFANLLSTVHPDAATRTAATECDLEFGRFSTSFYLDRALFERVAAVAAEPVVDMEADRRYRKLVEAFERSGIGLRDEAQRDEARNISDSIDRLSTEFAQTLASDTRQLSVNASDARSLAGLSAEFVATHTSADGGSVVITTNYPDVYHVYRHGHSAWLRRSMYKLARSRGVPSNLVTLRRVLELRWRYARLLGWEHYADYVTATKMIRTAAHANAFTTSVANLTLGASEAELQTLRALKRVHEPLADPTIEAYDASFYYRLLRERDFQLNSTELAHYFRFGSAKAGVLWAAAKLFNVRFERRAEVSAWHRDVECWDVYWNAPTADDARGDASAPATTPTPIGRFFLDMHPREDKYKHAAQFTVRDGVDGVQLPEGALVCNFPASGPMEFSQVTTFFHEFGHLMHHIIGGQQQAWVAFSGVATEWDFVEAPSQMLENWASDEETLRHFATHATTGAPLPPALVAALRASDRVGRATSARRQMFYAQISLQLHMRDPTVSGFDPADIVAQLGRRFSPYPLVEGAHFEANFGHLMGYSAIYYTYMWSQALAQQLLAPFERHGFYDLTTSLRYRDAVLRPGGKRPAETLIYEFLREPPNLEALHKWLRAE